MPFFGLRSRSRHTEPARQLYAAVVARAREPLFYERMSVPDTPDGRFDMIALHAALLLMRLQGDRAVPADVAQAVFDIMFADMDENLREMGVGDLAVGKRIKAMAKGFYGRLASYDAAISDEDRAALIAALKRNLYRKTQPSEDDVAAMAEYAIATARALREEDSRALAAGTVRFGPLPGMSATTTVSEHP